MELLIKAVVTVALIIGVFALYVIADAVRHLYDLHVLRTHAAHRPHPRPRRRHHLVIDGEVTAIHETHLTKEHA